MSGLGIDLAWADPEVPKPGDEKFKKILPQTKSSTKWIMTVAG